MDSRLGKENATRAKVAVLVDFRINCAIERRVPGHGLKRVRSERDYQQKNNKHNAETDSQAIIFFLNRGAPSSGEPDSEKDSDCDRSGNSQIDIERTGQRDPREGQDRQQRWIKNKIDNGAGGSRATWTGKPARGGE